MDRKDTLPRTDGWSVKPALVALTIVAVLTVLCQLPGSVSFVLIPLSAISYAVAALVILATAIYSVIRRRPRRAGSVLFILFLPALLWIPLHRAADLVHLGLTAGFGTGQLGRATRPNDADFAIYDWSVGLAGGPNTFLIHDLSDEIALPLSQHTHPPHSKTGLEEECAGNVRRLLHHYYVCTI